MMFRLRRVRLRRRLTKPTQLLSCSLLAGLVVAGAAFPAVAMSGLAAKAGAESFQDLPAELTVPQVPEATEVYAADGRTLLARFFDENRQDIPLDQIAPAMRNAMIAAEDHAFYHHAGVDLKGFLRALVSNGTGGAKQGASTLTMQLVRMSLTYGATDPKDVVAANEDTTGRKLREMRQAAALEKRLSKDQILERYLNMAPFGHGTYGVAAASRFYFGKEARDLTVPEAAMIAGLVKSPSYYDPLDTEGPGYRLALERRNWVIGQMREIGAITPAEEAAALATPLTVKGQAPANGCTSAAHNDWGFFCDFLYRWWLDQPAFGQTTYDRERQLKGGGYRIVTTLDPAVQKAAHRNVEQYLPTGEQDALMVAVVEPGTGRVRALATNRTFGLDDPRHPKNPISSNPDQAAAGIRGTYPRTTNPLLTGGGDITGYQAGSTFKIFTVVAALEAGYPLSYQINAPERYPSKYTAAAGSESACPGTERWCPGNDHPGMGGPHDMWSAFGRSVNTYFVPLEERVGAARVVDVARRLGIRFRAPNDAAMAKDEASADGWGSFTLGVSATTPLDLATAYATLAADGRHCEPIPVQEIRDRSGTSLDLAKPRCDQAVDPAVARAAIDAARCPVGDQSAYGRCAGATASAVRRVVGHPVAGKTGTTDSHRTASLVATTTTLTVAGILANPDWPETTENMDHGIVNPAVYETLADAMRGRPKQDFPKPDRALVDGDQRAVPAVTCRSVDDATAVLRGAGFRVEVDPNQVDSACPAGTVARTDPEGRTVAGGLVMLRLSNGQGAANAEPRGRDGADQDGNTPPSTDRAPVGRR
ncbi:transglycosylase domain-containing protein [Micromonospora sp. HM5-17]|uniref:transglycosylase domain-containing protein n=1 Tax=Micromonospora sp. HM5-17 TaxID=2487710 RepID=UPI001F28783C|nr:transglycosylase domain-containing protein [Micromonospora sp. HM5-17]